MVFMLRSFDFSQDRPFGSARDRLAQHERKFLNVFDASAVRPEPFDLAQDMLVEACGEFIETGEQMVFQLSVEDLARNGPRLSRGAESSPGSIFDSYCLRSAH